MDLTCQPGKGYGARDGDFAAIPSQSFDQSTFAWIAYLPDRRRRPKHTDMIYVVLGVGVKECHTTLEFKAKHNKQKADKIKQRSSA